MANHDSEKKSEKVHTNYIKNERNFPKDYWDFLLQSAEVHEADIHFVVMNYLLRPGYEEIAEEFHQEAKFKFFIPPGMINIKKNIRDELYKGNFDGAKELLNSISPHILEKDETLDFMLSLQELVDLIVRGKPSEAFIFARNHITKFVKDQNLSRIPLLEEALCLLAYHNLETGPAKEVLDKFYSLANDTMEIIENTIFEYYHINKEPILHSLMKNVIRSQKIIKYKMSLSPPILDDFESGKFKMSTGKNSKLTDSASYEWFNKSTIIQNQQIHDETLLVAMSNNKSRLSQRYPRFLNR